MMDNAVGAPRVEGSAPPPSEGSTLAAAQAFIDAAQSDSVALAGEVQAALAGSISAAVAAEPDLRAQFKNADEARQAAQRAYGKRFGKSPPQHGSDATTDTLGAWTEDAQVLASSLAAAKVPFRAQKRTEQQRYYDTWISRSLFAYARAQQRALTSVYTQFRSQALGRAEESFAHQIPRLADLLSSAAKPPSVVGYFHADSMSGTPVPGNGRLRVSAGFARLSQMRITFQEPLADPGTSKDDFHFVPTWPVGLQVFLDLGQHGGLVTDAKSTVDSMLLRLLALVPAGQLKIHIYDPVKLGESAEFLFGLGDATSAIIGDKVKSTDREINETLVELEEYITLVTQKYLQGAFDSLTDYNEAAGDIAEPYRILVLYDYPRGFVTPSGYADDEALARLAKVVSAGPRCGVFVLVVKKGDLPANMGAPVARLPVLDHDKVLESPLLDRLVAGGDVRLPDLSFTSPAVTMTQAAQVSSPRHGPLFVRGGQAWWLYEADVVPPDNVVREILNQVERGLAAAADVRVTPEHVAVLAHKRMERNAAIGTGMATVLPDRTRPDTWWHGSSLDEVVSDFGRVGAKEVASLIFDSRTFSGALVGGRPGAGKSVLLHSLIASLCLRYSPDELELYLIDFKEGVEFKVYAAGSLPHARVVAVESEREFGLSVLEGLNDEIERRGAMFREGGGEQLNLATYRQRSGQALTRIVLIVDEFHVLFERDDKIAARSAELLDRIVRQGRAFGVHTVLASQTLAGTVALGKHTLNQIPIRIALQCSETDSRLLLGDDNPEARLLTRPGEGIFNAANGFRDANQRFQATYWSGEERSALVSSLAAKARERGIDRHPVVFEGHQPVHVAEVAEDAFTPPRQTVLQAPVGLPMRLGDPVNLTLRREPGGNALVVASEDEALALLTVLLVSLCHQAEVEVIDFGATDSALAMAVEDLEQEGALRRGRARQLDQVLTELVEVVRERIDLQEYRGDARVLVLAGVHRARDLDADSGGDALDLLHEIVRDGPDVGVHVMVWCDRAVSLDRRLPQPVQRELGQRILGPMSRDDSFKLVDSDIAAGLDRSTMVLDDQDRATTHRVRRFEQPDLAWLRRMGRARGERAEVTR